jgi:hypothetical protein
MQQYADIYLLQSFCMFRASLRPSSGVLKTVTATSGIGHNIGGADQTTLEGRSCTNIMTYTRGSGYSFSTLDDGRSDARNI